MGYLKRLFFATPWHLIRFFIPFVAVVPAGVYYLTVFEHVYPGTSAFLTASAAGLCQQDDLSNPLFGLAIRAVAEIPFATLPLRLNLFCAACGALAVSFFYLFTARLVFICACEDPGGSMAALPPRTRETNDLEPANGQQGFSLNADGSVSIPVSVQAHNWRVARAAVLGGLGAALALAFCAPFWLVATRLYPFTFDLALFFLVINLLVSYDQRARFLPLFTGAFLLTACSVESPLFLLLLPFGGLFLLRALILNEQATTYKMLFVILAGLAGAVLAVVFIWQASAWCSAVPIPAPRPLLHVFLATVTSELVRWIPSFGWSYVFAQLLFPTSIALFVFSYSFRKRTFALFVLQLALITTLLPSLLNLSFSPWAIARLTSKVPVFGYTIIALMTGLMIAVWYLMRELFEEKIDDDLDFYEYRDNPVVCRIGSLLCWPLLLIVFAMPYRSFTDVDPRDGTFADAVTKHVYSELGARDWLVNCRLLPHHLMLRALQDGRQLHVITTTSNTRSADTLPLIAAIRNDPSFAPYRNRMLNAADLSPASFLREWMQHETNTYQRVVLFDSPELWRKNGFTAVPTGLFLSGLPQGKPVDSDAIIANHRAFVETLRPYLYPETPDSIRLFATIRTALRSQLALMANELGVLLVSQNRAADAMDLFKQAEVLRPDNLCILLNRYHLAANLSVQPETLPEIETRLRDVPRRVNTFLLTPANLQTSGGTLVDPDSLEYVRKNLWIRGTTFRNLAITTQKFHSDPLTALRDKKRELHQTISSFIDTYEFDDAERQLNLLLDLDDKDTFALINKARIAIERRNLPEAGLWMDLAKENGATADQLIWHEAALLILDNKLAEARAMLNTAIPATPSDIRLWGLLADILLRLGEYSELENRVYPALRSATSKKEHYLMYLVRGHILKRNGPKDYPSARAAFLRALAINKNLTSVNEELLRLDDALDVPAFSEQDAKEILRRDPEHSFANFLWGTVRLRRGELDLAEDLFKRSLEKEHNAPAYAGLGAVMLERKAYEDAEKLLRRALELDKTRLFTLHALARLFLDTDRLSEASDALAPVLDGRPEDLDARITLIRLRMQQKKLEEAAVLISDLLENEDLLPYPIVSKLRPLAAQLKEELSK